MSLFFTEPYIEKTQTHDDGQASIRNSRMHAFIVATLMFAFPVTSILIESVLRDHGHLEVVVVGKWFVFWAVVFGCSWLVCARLSSRAIQPRPFSASRTRARRSSCESLDLPILQSAALGWVVSYFQRGYFRRGLLEQSSTALRGLIMPRTRIAILLRTWR